MSHSAKRTTGAILGVTVMIGSLLPLGYAFEILGDFGNPGVSFWPNVLGVVVLGSLAFAGFWFGFRLLPDE
ncbi:MAG: hypothetical protein JO119_10420 [Acidobacteria bacterium]|nr:hypothetical protein [Acidobacteriota bacterium]